MSELHENKPVTRINVLHKSCLIVRKVPFFWSGWLKFFFMLTFAADREYCYTGNMHFIKIKISFVRPETYLIFFLAWRFFVSKTVSFTIKITRLWHRFSCIPVLPGLTILISPMLPHPGPDKNHVNLMHLLYRKSRIYVVKWRWVLQPLRQKMTSLYAN